MTTDIGKLPPGYHPCPRCKSLSEDDIEDQIGEALAKCYQDLPVTVYEMVPKGDLDKANARIAELEGLLGQVHTAATDWAKGSKIDGNKLISDIENALPKEPKT